MVQTFLNDNNQTANTNCLAYKWSGLNFDLIDELPCSNAMRIEAFIIESEVYLAIANNKDGHGKYDV